METEYIELNLNNYTHEQVEQLNAWAIEAVQAIEELANEVKSLANARDEHNERLTHDGRYQEYHNKQQKEREFEQHGIDE